MAGRHLETDLASVHVWEVLLGILWGNRGKEEGPALLANAVVVVGPVGWHGLQQTYRISATARRLFHQMVWISASAAPGQARKPFSLGSWHMYLALMCKRCRAMQNSFGMVDLSTAHECNS